MSRDELEIFVGNLEIALRELKVNPLFPYPICVINQHFTVPSAIQILKNKEQFPQHFSIEWKKMKEIDSPLANKALTLSQKISGMDVENLLNHLMNEQLTRRALVTSVREKYFYHNLLQEEKL